MIFCNHRMMSTIVNVSIFMNWPHFACNINYWSRNNLMQSFLLFVTWFLIARSFPLMDFMRSIVVDMNSKLLFYYNNSPLLRFIQIIRDDYDFFSILQLISSAIQKPLAFGTNDFTERILIQRRLTLIFHIIFKIHVIFFLIFHTDQNIWRLSLSHNDIFPAERYTFIQTM